MVMPGDNVAMDVELITPIAMEEKLRFAIREGGERLEPGLSRRSWSNRHLIPQRRKHSVPALLFLVRRAVSFAGAAKPKGAGERGPGQ